jgi:AAA15 family ATPase/GTPase
LITSLEIKNYKCFKDITLSNLSRINLFSGSNNVGKSAVLEAIWLNAGFFNPTLPLYIYGFRNWPKIQNYQLMLDLFRGYNYDNKIGLKCKGESDLDCREHSIQAFDTDTPISGNRSDSNSFDSVVRNEKELRLETKIKNYDDLLKSKLSLKKGQLAGEAVKGRFPNSVFVTVKSQEFSDDEFDAFTHLTEEGKQELLIKSLQEFEPNLEDIQIASTAGQKSFYVRVSYIKNRQFPINQLGSGIQHLLRCVFAIVRSQDGTVIIDEIENGIYHKNLGIIWEQLLILAEKFNVQIFASTHSYECIREAHNALKGKDALKVYRLDRPDSEIEATEYDEKSLGASLKFNMEIR